MFSLTQQTTTAVVEHGAAAQGAEPAASAPGMPQLDFALFPNQIFWLIVSLCAIYWVLSRVALPRISGVIADRQGAITSDLMAAEEYKKKAQEAEAAYDKALADARAESQKIIAANRAEIQAELDKAIAHADAEIAARSAESEQRIGEIRAAAATDARTVARDVASEIIRSFGGRADEAAIDRALTAQTEKGKGL
ncbi:F0F1 ATP synthase subunit B' [Paracoccus pacificus]|uniref:ATP synthase subunit b n=1 Tax=Paracoccus pacificus TaxID=1463598 RepID=A0ABW4R8M8_9RHOB